MKISYYMHYTLFIFSCNDPRDFLATLSNALQFNYYQPNYSYRDMHLSVLSTRISMYFFKFISPTIFFSAHSSRRGIACGRKRLEICNVPFRLSLMYHDSWRFSYFYTVTQFDVGIT